MTQQFKAIYNEWIDVFRELNAMNTSEELVVTLIEKLEVVLDEFSGSTMKLWAETDLSEAEKNLIMQINPRIFKDKFSKSKIIETSNPRRKVGITKSQLIALSTMKKKGECGSSK